jgi:menaquinone-specific isochorismate synthase
MHPSVIDGQPYPLHRLHIPLPNFDLIHWLQSHPVYPKVFWKERDSHITRAAVGNLIAFSHIPHFSSSNPFNMRLYGGIRFRDNVHADETWKGFPNRRFWLPHIELSQEKGQTQATLYSLGEPASEDSLFLPLMQKERSVSSCELVRRNEVPTFEDWQKHVSAILESISAHRIDKLVLARKTTLQFSSPPSPWPILSHLNERAKHTTLFAFQLAPDLCFLGATPETLFVRRGLLLSTEAIAATRPRGTTDEEDLALEKDLLTGSKEQREFNIVKDYLTAALSPLTSALQWEKSDRVLKTSHVQHLYNLLNATLKEAISDTMLIRALHPTPALGGYPREEALKFLQEIEPFDRGWYGGPIGTVEQEGANLYVAIRSALIQGRSLHLFAGTGLVPGSAPEHEWEELEQKIRPLTELFV